jgi:hypothetical protein
MQNTFLTSDYVSLAQSNYTQQFKNKPVFDRYVGVFSGAYLELQNVLRELKIERTLDNAFGFNLDIIGKIVGYDRLLVNVNADGYFAFSDVPNAKGFGEVNDTALGGKLFSREDITTGNLLLNDDLYRVALRAIIRASVSNGSIDDVVDTANLIVADGVLDVIDLGTGEVELYLSRELTAFESLLFFGFGQYNSILPKAAGIIISVIVPNRDLRTLYVLDGYFKPGYVEFKDAPFIPEMNGATLVLDFANNNYLKLE